MTFVRQVLLPCILCAVSATDLGAQPLEFPAAEILALGAHAYEPEAGMRRRLEVILPDLVIEPAAPLAVDEDPFRWAMGGSFGGQGASPVPGAIFGCARYGLFTRDLFRELGLVHRRTFPLISTLLPLYDDEAVWPEGAVARLHCVFIWDDAETVRIMPEEVARRSLRAVFDEIRTDEDASVYEPLLGEDGFRLFGQNGESDSVSWLESGDVILTNGHQQVSFRAFLMGGAV